MPYIIYNGVKYGTSTVPITQEEIDEVTNETEQTEGDDNNGN